MTRMVDSGLRPGESMPQEKKPSGVMSELVSERHDTKRKLMQRKKRGKCWVGEGCR